jgi:uncharacterized membrane protein
MKSKLLNVLSELRASYWYIPLLMSIASLLCSILTLRLDHLLVLHWLESWGWFHASNPEGARAVLSTIATSMITVAGVTFSMTIMAVAFAASQVGPRLISNFMRDRANQITLGTFIATFLFCLFIMLALFNGNKEGVTESGGLVFIPQISLLMAVFFTISSIIVLISFIHHIPESINISNVIAQIGEELNRQVDCQFPINVGKEVFERNAHIPKNHPYRKAVVATKLGYVRILDGDTLIAVAKKHDLIIQLEARSGTYVTEGSTLLNIYSLDEVEESVCEQCVGAFALGHQRNQEHDIMFLIDEMVEVIARALSPGINDPFTAMTCLDWLQSTVKKISKTSPPSAYRYDSEDTLRLVAQPISFTEFCDLIFCRVQPYVCKDRNTAMHMMEMIHLIHVSITNNEHQITLASHAVSLKNAAIECLPINEDRKKIQKLYQKYFDHSIV